MSSGLSFIGVDIGGTKIAGARVSSDGGLGEVIQRPTPTSGEEVLEVTTKLVRELFASDIEAIGVGVAGLVRPDEGEFVYGPHVPGTNLPFGTALSDEFGLPVAVDNDANASGLAEARLGAGRGHSHVLVVNLGTGIGGSWVVDGRVQRGGGFGGEFGHMSVAEAGPPCACGRHGCWETLASGGRLDQLAREAVEADPTGAIARAAAGEPALGSHVGEAARAGDPVAVGLVEGVARWLGIGLANLIAAFDPDVIVIGGGAGRLGDLLLPPARDIAAAETLGHVYRGPTPIHEAFFGPMATVVGAGLLAGEDGR